jgi:acylglycerol lipase
MVHGYANDISWTFQNTAVLFTEMGYAAVASDLEGHGRTEGLHGYLPNVDGAAQDCVEFFNSVTETEEFKGIPKFIYGESLGGAIALMVHFLQPEKWDGLIAAAAMCKLTDDVRPSWVLLQLLLVLAYLFPTWAITPTNEYLEKSVRDDRKRELARQNPQRYVCLPLAFKREVVS